MADVPIVVPSRGRAGRVTTHHVLPSAILCVSESAEDEYREKHPEATFVICPDAMETQPRKRQWIYDEFGDVFMVDDDITSFRTHMVNPRETQPLASGISEAIIQRNYDTARQLRDALGIYLWGFAHMGNIREYNEHDPFRFSGYVPGAAFGMLKGSKLWFQPDVLFNLDYWLCCLNAHHHRMVFVDTRYGVVQKDTFHNVGGLATVRNSVTVVQQLEKLQKAFGKQVISKKHNKRPKSGHDWQVKMKLPF